MKKRILAMALLLVLLITAGCSKVEKQEPANTSESSSTTEKENKTAEVKESEEPIVIEWLGPNHDVREKSEPILAMEEKYNCTFNFWNIDPERKLELLGVKLASGEMPDTFMIEPDTTLQPYIKQGVAAEITQKMFDRIPNYTKVYEPFNQDGNLFVDTMNDGKIYGLKEVNLTGSYPTILVWNKRWLTNVGINKIPETIDEFEEAMYKFVNEDPDGNGKKDTYGMSTTVMNAIFGAYGPVPLKEFRGGKGRQKCFMYEEDDQLKFAVTQPSMKDALVKLQQWYKDGIIDPEFITGENTGGYWAVSQAFANQRIGVTGMVMATHWNPPLTDVPTDEGGAVYKDYKSLHPDTVFGEDIEIGPSIEGPEGFAGTHAWGSRGKKFIITTQAASNERKLDVILNLINDNASDFEQATLLSYGIKGKHYDIDEASGNYINNSDFFGEEKPENFGIGSISFGSDPMNRFTYWAKGMEFMDKYKTRGYEDGVYPTVDSHAKYTNDLNRLALETYINIITGNRELSEFDTFVEDFYQSGGQEIVDEINAEYEKMIGK